MAFADLPPPGCVPTLPHTMDDLLRQIVEQCDCVFSSRDSSPERERNKWSEFVSMGHRAYSQMAMKEYKAE
eukprot:408308-Rhodomonas_salina.1